MLRSLLLITTGLILLTGCGGGPAKPEADPTLARPGTDLPYPTKVGAKWVYERFDVNGEAMGEEVVVVAGVEQKGDEKIVTVETSRGNVRMSVERLAVSPKEVATLVEMAGRDEVRMVRFRLPHTPGETWEFDIGDEKGTDTAQEPEQVEVPAGKFEALRVDSVYSILGGRPRQVTDWYVPGIGRVKQASDGKVHRVLKSFTPGKD